MTIVDINTLLKNYLLHELNEPDKAIVDFTFNLPNKKWLTDLNDGTKNWINMYLLNIEENLDFRSSEWKKEYSENGMTKSRPPLYMNIYYMFTFYNKETPHNVLKEHEYLELVLLLLRDFSHLAPSVTTVNQDIVENITIELFPKPYIDNELGFQLWSALDQDVRPFIPLKIIIPLESKVQPQSQVTVLSKSLEIHQRQS